jgi:hypothetical protein
MSLTAWRNRTLFGLNDVEALAVIPQQKSGSHL